MSLLVSEHVWIGGGGIGGSYQPGVYVPLKALFLVGTLLHMRVLCDLV